MPTRKVIGTLMTVVGLTALFGVSWQAAVGVFLVVWGNELWHDPGFSQTPLAKLAREKGGEPADALEGRMVGEARSIRGSGPGGSDGRPG